MTGRLLWSYVGAMLGRAQISLPIRLGVVFFGVGLFLLAGTVVGAGPASAQPSDVEDEIFFYQEDGLFRYYETKPDASITSIINGGDGYTSGWDQIVAIDLDGGGQDEMLFYRDDGLFRYYNLRPNGTVGPILNGGDGYTADWSQITAIDLDGDGQDEILFYRDDGLFRYYDIRANGSLGAVINGGDGYTAGWDQITAIDLDGDSQDEILFYRDDGLFRYYNINANASLGPVLNGGDGYSAGWDQIKAIDLDGDAQDEILFYRDDGLYRYYDIRPSGNLGGIIKGGTGYSAGWDQITPLEIDGDQPLELVSRFTTFFDCCQPRVTNIRQIAREIDGTLVLPGETFSIDAITGPRTSAGGYVPAPYLVNGQGQCCAVGGGVSQFGTTIHNAVFWGGYEVISHRPHSGWISRYPLGIEATLVYSAIDYRFRNDTPNPVRVRTSSTSTSVTVEIWGNQGGWQVAGFHPRGARNSTIRVIDRGGVDAKRVSGLVIGNAPGVVRIIRTLVVNGVSRTQTWWWNYVS